MHLKIEVDELDEDGAVYVRFTDNADYGLPNAVLNGESIDGTLSLNYRLKQLGDFEYYVSIGLIIGIVILSLLSSYVITYKEENPRTGWLLIGLELLVAAATLALQYPGFTYEGQSNFEGVTLFYKNVTSMPIRRVLTQLEGGMYLSTLNNLIMILAVRILHLRANVFVFTESISVLIRGLITAPFCSHYFKKYFTREFRFVCALLVATCILAQGHIATGYYAAYFILLLLIFDFENINNIIYGIILVIVPVVCTSKMTFVLFFPLSIIYFLLFRKTMNTKKKICVATIGISSFLEGFLSLALRNGVQNGHRLGTIQDVTIWNLIHKSIYYMVQEFNSLFLYRIPILDGLFTNVITATLIVCILLFALWQLWKKLEYAQEAKFILLMFCLILGQNAFLLLTTVDWYGEISWSSVIAAYTGQHTANQYMAVVAIFLCVLWTYIKYRRNRGLSFSLMNSLIVQLVAALCICFFVNMHPNAKIGWGWDTNPTISRADWKTYVSMLDSDAYCIRIEGKSWYYNKNSTVKSLPISRCSTVNLSDLQELNEKNSFVFYVHKAAETNQICDRYYYMSIYDNDGNLVSQIKQMNSNAERPYIAFYLKEGVSDIGYLDFSYEDGSRAFVDETIEIGYR